MAMITDDCVVFNEGHSIYNAVIADCSSRVDHGFVHYNGTLPDSSMLRDMGQWRDDDRQSATKPFYILKQSYPILRVPDLANRDEHIVLFYQTRQVIISANHFITQDLRTKFFRHVNYPSNTVGSILLDNINAGFAMSASADKN